MEWRAKLRPARRPATARRRNRCSRSHVPSVAESQRFATCNMARGTGPTFLAALAGVLQMNGKPTLYGLDGFLWSDEEEGRTVMGVTSTRGSRPLRVYHSTMWTGHWYPQRRSQVGP